MGPSSWGRRGAEGQESHLPAASARVGDVPRDSTKTFLPGSLEVRADLRSSLAWSQKELKKGKSPQIGTASCSVHARDPCPSHPKELG